MRNYEYVQMFVRGLCGDDIEITVEDCIVEDDRVVYLVRGSDFDIGRAIGLWGQKVRVLERLMEKKVKIIQLSDDLGTFIRNCVRCKCKLEAVGDGQVLVKIPRADFGKIIGTNGKNAELIKRLVRERFNVEIVFKEM